MYISLPIALLVFALNASGTPLPSPAPQSYYLPKRLITLEEHAISPSLEAELAASPLVKSLAPGVFDKLKDVGPARIAAMDAGHVSLQVLAQTPGSGSEDPEGCRKANDAIRSVIAAHPKRFAGFAVLPMAFPEQAAAELERSVTQLGLKGAMIWNHLKDGTYYDGAKFDIVFATAERLDVPIYIHPVPPAAEIAEKLFAGNYPNSTAGQLGGASWGWHVDVGLHILRLYSAGLFNRHPKLKIIIGHDGEGLPMFIDRVDTTHLRSDLTLDKVWNTNIWVTISGFFSVRNLKQLRLVTPIERIMYSVDYPFGNNTDGWQFIQELSKSKTLTDREMDLFAYKNAERLLRL